MLSLRLRVLCSQWWYLLLDLSAAKLYLWEWNQMIENCVQISVFNLLTNSMPVNGQVYDIANRHTGFRKHFICEETLSWGDSPTHDQDISRIKYTHGANFTKLCRRHQEMSTTSVPIENTLVIGIILSYVIHVVWFECWYSFLNFLRRKFRPCQEFHARQKQE